MSKLGFFYPDPTSVAIRDFQAKSGDSWKNRGGWTVCEIKKINKLKKALKDGRKFIYKLADISTVYTFTLNIIRTYTIPFSPVFFIFIFLKFS